MLADKTLLGTALALTFASGGTMGYFAHDSAGTQVKAYTAEAVFAGKLEKLEAQGYDAEAVGEAREAYQRYLDEYQPWWDAFLEAHVDNLETIEAGLTERLQGVEDRWKARDPR